MCCNSDVIAKCGNFKVHHWAHKSKVHCDPWWDNESEWHRHWKSYFPVSNQEYIFTDTETGERHVADVFSSKGVVIEFQSYAISPQEMNARESFYKKMIWVVNGAKRQSDLFIFNQGLSASNSDDPCLHEITWFGRGKLFHKWIGSTKHVYFDFGGEYVWHLIKFNHGERKGLVKSYRKDKFVRFFGGTYYD
ncbi:competence protein CoiA family protein [Cobetia sp. 14N.309.X.WAT.E.A4]|uniref:competence protein CoiA n=1 Tax=unclassified Cobetia TaxID=2609414 RepID=UPI00244B0FA6|nr:MULTISPECIES: competence protein CoiA family protein [unclassified Cobetia]MDH2292101.1 competence protein CoiA family protein [Cobetia sp. 10Alg 146]MDN2655686.1 competence protein CoiA family protein [Cobetia sp. 14N.309.X.WAT.E.A4]